MEEPEMQQPSIDAAAAHKMHLEAAATLIRKRREAAGTPEDWPVSALALSGGGIRSATFCLGLLRGLARNEMLHRFDYLSTVSGGGYVGAALGRLYQPGQGARTVEAGLGSDNSLLLWWLRSNGRYLTPAGARDLVQALASILRGVLSTQFEVAVLMLFTLAWLLAPRHLAATHGLWQGSASVLLWLLVLPLFGGLHQIFAYWYCREKSSLGLALSDWLAALGCAGAGLWLFQSQPALNLRNVAALLLLSPLTALLASLWTDKDKANVSARRLAHTKGLGTALWVLFGIAAAAGLDTLAWLATSGGLHRSDLTISLPPALLTTVLAAAHVGLPYLRRHFAGKPGQGYNVLGLINALGLATLLGLALIWAAVLHLLLQSTHAPSAPLVWLLVTLSSGLYLFLTRSNMELPNLTSLHNFYRARIERAYVSVGNYPPAVKTAPRFKQSPLAVASRDATEKVAPLVEAVAGDDVPLKDYQPHEHGGPIHLISSCINQSVDDRTGNYNADRKGIALTVSALGSEVGTRYPKPGSVPSGPLSRWIAISGAAASSGMGSRTASGTAALLFLSGLRLGYWTPTLEPTNESDSTPLTVPPWKRVLVAAWPKPAALCAELLARFPGLRSPAWYLSDGGHFENTGVYALLKRQVPLIVVADCGADPRYEYEDLENLVRKARIDYSASIDFIDPATLPSSTTAQHALHMRIGTRETINSTPGPECLLLARIHYAYTSQPGLLIVVKPRRLGQMPLDLTSYAARESAFPQQTTGDQFFDEAQWEAYHQLGLAMGQLLTPAAVLTLAASAAPAPR